MTDAIKAAIEASREREKICRDAGVPPSDMFPMLFTSDAILFREALAVAVELLSAGCEIGPQKRSKAIVSIERILAGEKP